MANTQSERDTEFRRALLEAQAETTLDGLLVVDADRNVLYHNDRFLDMWGIPEEVAAERSDQTLLEYVDSLLADSAEFRETVEHLYEQPEETSRDTIRLTDGRWFERYSAPVVGADGTRYGRLWTFRDITERMEKEARLRETREMLRSVQQTMASSAPLTEKMTELLEFGRTYLGVEHGFFARIDDDEMQIRAASGPNEQLQAGQSAPLSAAYCRHTVDPETEAPLTVEHASEEGWEDDPAFERFGLECYVGAPVFVDDDVYGTICFVDREPAREEFTEPQQTFVELLTEWAGYELQQRKRERQHRRLTERVSDAYYAFDPDWTVTYWNDAVADRSGVPAEEIVGTNFWEQFPELEGTVYEDTLREAMQSQNSQSCEFYYEEGDYWVELQAYPDDEGISVISQEITERKQAREALRESQERLDAFVTATSDVVYRMSPDWSEMIYLEGQEFLADTDEPQQTWLEEYIPPDERPRVTAAIEEAIETKSVFDLEHQVMQVDGTRGWTHSRAVPMLDDDGEIVEWFGTASDITERKERERELERQRDELAQLQRLDTLVREINRALQDETTRAAIERDVCDRLVDSELYQAAWIGGSGERSTGEQVVVPRTSAGVDETYLEDIPGGERGSARRAIDTGDVQVVSDVASAEDFPDARREIALEHEHRTLAAVPLATGDATHGVLVVYAPPEHTIDEREQAVLADFGRTIARAIQRVHSRRSLTADTAVELEFRVPDADNAFAAASAELGCEIELARRVPATDGADVYYVRVRDADPERVCDRLCASATLDSGTVVSEASEAEPAVVEVVRADRDDVPPLPIDVLVGHGVSIGTVRSVEGDTYYSVTASPELSVRTLREALGDVEPSVELVSKRLVDRPVATVPEIKDTVRDRLTPKQEAALEAAYARGYYAWPRTSNAEDVADVLDVSASTLHYHLRRAHQTVLEALFEEYDGPTGR